MLALFDLDGFKHYNDSYGHPAGDALLQRLGAKLADHVAGAGTAYRMGGDEFCVLLGRGPSDERHVAACAGALTEHGDGFTITCSFGSDLGAAARPTTPARRCASPTSACTRTSTAAAARHAARAATCCCARWPSATPSWASTSAAWPSWPRPSRAAWSSTTSRSTTSATPPRCTTSARSRSPTRSSTSPPRSTTPSGSSSAATRSSASASSPPRRRCARSPRSCARATSAGTAAATPTPWPARRSRSARASSRSATPSTRWSPTAPTARGMDAADALAELERCAGSQFDPAVVEAFAAAWVGRPGAARRRLAQAPRQVGRRVGRRGLHEAEVIDARVALVVVGWRRAA